MQIYFFLFSIKTELRVRREVTKTPSHEDMLLVQSIQITDKFGFEKQTAPKPKSTSSETVFIATEPGLCVNGLGNYSQQCCYIYIFIYLVFFRSS